MSCVDLRGAIPSRVAALALAVLLGFGACKAEEPAPVVAVRTFIDAVQSRNSTRVLPLLSNRLRAELEAAAGKASDQVGGRAAFEAAQMLELVGVDMLFSVRGVEIVRQDETSATVQVRGDGDVVHMFELTLEDGTWRIHVPPPR